MNYRQVLERIRFDTRGLKEAKFVVGEVIKGLGRIEVDVEGVVVVC